MKLYENKRETAFWVALKTMFCDEVQVTTLSI